MKEFKDAAPLVMLTMNASLCDPPDMICIVEDHTQTDQADNEEIYLTMEEATILREWLNEVIP